MYLIKVDMKPEQMCYGAETLLSQYTEGFDMKQITPSLLAVMPMLMLLSASVSAETRYEQKLILVQGTESRFMKGEPAPLFDFRRDSVLPYLLSRGWKIASVHVNERSKEDNPYGYVVVEREIPSN